MVGALSVAQMVSWGTNYYSFAVLLPHFETAFSAERTTISLAMTLSLLAGGVAAFGAGRAMRAHQDRALMSYGSLLGGVGFALMAMSTNLAMLYLAWILVGISCAGTLYAPAFALITRLYPTDFRAKITTLTLLGGLASTVFWPLMTLLVNFGGWQFACWVAAAFHWLICFPIHWRVIPKSALHSAPEHQLNKTRGNTPLSANEQRIFLAVVIYMLLESLVQAGISAHLLQILEQKGLPLGFAVAIASCFGLIQTLARGTILRWGSNITPRALARWVVFLSPLALVLLYFASTWIVFALAFALLYGIGNGLSTIVRGTSIADLISREKVPHLNGPMEFARSLASASGPFFAALLYLKSDYDTVLLCMIFLLLVSAFAMRLAWHLRKSAH